MICASAVLEWIASLPPRRIQTLEDLRQRHAASTVTLGRASKIIPTTPIGVRTFSIFNPFGRVPPSMTCPTGSGRPIRSRTAPAIPSIRAAVSRRRSCNDSDIPFCAAAFRSSSLAARISGICAQSASAIAASAAFFCAVDAQERVREAAFARLPSSVKRFILSTAFQSSCGAMNQVPTSSPSSKR